MSSTPPSRTSPADASAFRPVSLALRGRLVVTGKPDEIFPLFSPLGEQLWVPGWSPELLHPEDVAWAEGQVFRTREETGEEVVWIVTRLDRDAREVEYRRVVPGRYVATVAVRCEEAGENRVRADVSYAYVGLSEAGNREIEAMTPEAYDAKMARWREWIEALRSRAGGADPGNGPEGRPSR